MCGALSLTKNLSMRSCTYSVLVRDHLGELAAVLVVGEVEPLCNELRMLVVLGEDDGLAQPVPTSDPVPVGHQRLQDLIDRVGVEQPGVYRLGINLVGDLPSSSHSRASH